jgi:hypothetical protein
MQIKKQVLENLKGYFQKEIRKLEMEIDSNRREINRLTEKQTILKRSKAKLDQLSRGLE